MLEPSSACPPPTTGVQLQQLDSSVNPPRGEAVTFNISVSQPEAVATTVGDCALETVPGRDTSNSQEEIALETALSWKKVANVDRGAVSAAKELVVTSNDRGTPEYGTRPQRPTRRIGNDLTSSGESDIEGTLQKEHVGAARDVLKDKSYKSTEEMTLKGKKVSSSAKPSFSWTDDARETLVSVILEKKASGKLKMVLQFHPRGISRQERLVARQQLKNKSNVLKKRYNSIRAQTER
jgi:hypothetical protein